MKLWLAVLFLLVAEAATRTVAKCHHDDDDDDDDCQDDPEAVKLSNNLVILTADIINTDKSVDNSLAEKEEVLDKVIDLRYRIRALEGSPCQENDEFQCGGKEPKCVSRLLICDKTADCPNAADEAQCDVLTPADSTWEGIAEYDHCTKRQAGKFELHIESYTVNDVLRSFPEVTGHTHIEKQTDDATITDVLHVTGHLDLEPGNHVLRFEPPESDGLSFECTFDGVNNDHCHGVILHQLTQEVCAEYYVKRI